MGCEAGVGAWAFEGPVVPFVLGMAKSVWEKHFLFEAVAIC